MTLVRAVSAGLLLGAVWGVFLRVFMRLLVVWSHFSWSGTLSIIGVAAVAGLGFALVWWARESGRSAWWRCAALLAAPLVLFPQGIIFLLPAVVCGGLVLSGRPPRWLQALLAAAVLLAPGGVLWIEDGAPPDMPLPVVLTVLYTLMITLAMAGAEIFRRWPGSAAAAPPNQLRSNLGYPGDATIGDVLDQQLAEAAPVVPPVRS